MKVEIFNKYGYFCIITNIIISLFGIGGLLFTLPNMLMKTETYMLLSFGVLFYTFSLSWFIRNLAESIYIYKNFNNSYIQYDNKDVKFVQHNRKTKSFHQEWIDVIVIYKSPFWIDFISFFEFRLKDGRSILVGDFEEENRILRPLLTGYIDIRYEKYFIPIWIKKYLESTLIKKIKNLADKYL